MGLTTLVTQPVSTLGITSWKVVMKSEIVMLLIFGSFFSKCTFLGCDILSRLVLINSIFSVVVCIYKILVSLSIFGPPSSGGRGPMKLPLSV